MSVTIEAKSAVASGWKTIAALPELRSSSVISSVIAAVDIANSRLSAGAFILRLPVRMSNRPIDGGGALQLHLEALQRRDPLLHRRMRGEQAAERLARAGREDVERRELLRSRAGRAAGIRCMPPEIRVSAEASALGRPVISAAPRSAANSR